MDLQNTVAVAPMPRLAAIGPKSLIFQRAAADIAWLSKAFPLAASLRGSEGERGFDRDDVDYGCLLSFVFVLIKL